MSIIALVSHVAIGLPAYVFYVCQELRAINKIKCTFQNLFLLHHNSAYNFNRMQKAWCLWQ